MLNKHFASDLINHFFIGLNNLSLKYAVLRNYELLPDANESKDVDIVVSPDDLERIVTILKSVAKELDYQLIWVNKLDYLDGFVFTKVDGVDIFSIKLDIFNGFRWRGCTYIDHDIVLNSAIDYNGFKVPLKAHEAFIMIVYYALYAKKIRTKYLTPIYENSTKNINDFELITRDTFDSALADAVIRKVKRNKISDLVLLRKNIRSNVVRSSIRGPNIVGRFLRHIKTEYWNRNTFGALLVFSGPDGAGKSTLVDDLLDLLYSVGISSNKTPHHFLSSSVPSLHKLPGAPVKYAKQDYTKLYQAKTAGLFSSLIRTVYYYLAFLLDRTIYVKKELRRNDVVVFDRYYTDLVVDPTRIRIGLSKNIVKKIFKMLPSPDYTFVIVANTDQILKRKDELTEAKLVELLKEYSDLPRYIPRCEVLKNTGTVQEGKLAIYKSVFNSLETFYK